MDEMITENDEEYINQLVRELQSTRPEAINPTGAVIKFRKFTDVEPTEMPLIEFAFMIRRLEIQGKARLSPYGGDMVFIAEEKADNAYNIMIPPELSTAWWTAHYIAIRTVSVPE